MEIDESSAASGEAGVNSKSKSLFISIWIVSLVFTAIFGFMAGKSSNSSGQELVVAPAPPDAVLGAENQAASTPTPSVDLTGICKKSGVSLKSEYLPTYTIQEGDSLQSIAETQLEDVTRVNELTALNSDVSGLTAGSTIYLPPSNLKKTSGNLVQISGMIIKKDNAIWQLSYGGGEKGLGIAIPAYYFSEVGNKDTFAVGDCVTIFMDNGVKVYTAEKQ